MSGESSSREEWWSLLEPAPAELFFSRGDPEDPRLGDVVKRWPGGAMELHAHQPVLIGFPCDEGVRRNGGRVGAAGAPRAIREQFYRLASWEPASRRLGATASSGDLAQLELVDAGDVRQGRAVENAQRRLGEVVANVLRAGAVPVILGGGHETAFGHYLGYADAGIACAILNIDAHLDVRAYPHGGHSGSPFRQAFEHAPQPLGHGCYVVIGAQRQSTAQAHWNYVQNQGGRVHWLDAPNMADRAIPCFVDELNKLGETNGNLFLTIDADAFRQADVPGVSAPSPVGLAGELGPEIATLAGATPPVRSFEIVEVNPVFDRDAQSSRWAALCVRQFLVGLMLRSEYARQDSNL
jgi:formiminoglutamase